VKELMNKMTDIIKYTLNNSGLIAKLQKDVPTTAAKLDDDTIIFLQLRRITPDEKGEYDFSAYIGNVEI